MTNVSVSPIAEFMRYNNWANRQVLAACQALDERQLAATAVGTFGTIRATLEHIIRAEESYAARLSGTRLQPPFRWEDKPTLAALAAYAAQVGDALAEAVTRGQPTDLIQQRRDGETVTYQAIVLWIQIINHGIEHRTNITTILNQLALPAPDVAGWSYFDANRDRFSGQDASSVQRRGVAGGEPATGGQDVPTHSA